MRQAVLVQPVRKVQPDRKDSLLQVLVVLQVLQVLLAYKVLAVYMVQPAPLDLRVFQRRKVELVQLDNLVLLVQLAL